MPSGGLAMLYVDESFATIELAQPTSHPPQVIATHVAMPIRMTFEQSPSATAGRTSANARTAPSGAEQQQKPHRVLCQ